MPDRWYRGALIRQRLHRRQPHGWWLLPEGPLEGHPDKGWVRTIEEARAEVDRHLDEGGCLMQEGGRWLGVPAESRRAADSIFGLTLLQGYSPWCAARKDLPHQPCSTSGCPCECHGSGQATPL